MQKLTIALTVVIASLGYLAATPSDTARLFRGVFQETEVDALAAYATVKMGHDRGEAFYTVQLGMRHLFAERLPNGEPTDPAYGAGLIREAMAKGYARAGTVYYVFVDKTQEGLREAAEAGSPHAVGILAIDLALQYCDQGELPQIVVEEFLARYLDRMDPGLQGRFVPLEFREKMAADYLIQYERTVEGMLHGLREHFGALCQGKDQWAARLLPSD